METWHWWLIGTGSIMTIGIIGYLLYWCAQRQKQRQEEKYNSAITTNQGQKEPLSTLDTHFIFPPTPPKSTSPRQHPSKTAGLVAEPLSLSSSPSSSSSPLPPPTFITELSAPPLQFFLGRKQSRWQAPSPPPPPPTSLLPPAATPSAPVTSSSSTVAMTTITMGTKGTNQSDGNHVQSPCNADRHLSLSPFMGHHLKSPCSSGSSAFSLPSSSSPSPSPMSAQTRSPSPAYIKFTAATWSAWKR